LENGNESANAANFAEIRSKVFVMSLNTESAIPTAGARESDIGYKVMTFLFDKKLSTDPVHYWVAYVFLSNSHKKLTAAMRSHLQASKPLDTYFMYELHEQFISADTFRKFIGIGDDVRDLLGGLIESAHEADRNTTGLNQSLEENVALLHQVSNADDIKRVARNLADAVVTANARNTSLKKSLEATEQEARALRDQLERHRQEAIIDPLTGLYNRRGMQVEMDRVLMQGVEIDHAMLVIDIDHFKKINDSYGHAVGDAVIRKVGETLRDLLPVQAVPARFGGEEFVALLSNTPLAQAKAVAEEIRLGIERMRLVRRQDKSPLSSITVSVGVAQKEQGDTVDSLFNRADTALYKAKNAGRNRIESATG